MFTNECHEIGDRCLDKWVEKMNTEYWSKFVDFNGMMILTFSEPLALLPYLLRSLRIKKMFIAREIYVDTGKMPKNMIWKWMEKRISVFLIAGLILYAFIGYTITWLTSDECNEDIVDSNFCFGWP